MNRIKMREIVRKLKRAKGLKKKKTNGAYGRPPEYIIENKKKESLRRSKITKPVANKEVTKSNSQPIETKEVKTDTQPIQTKEVKNNNTQLVETKEVKEKSNEKN